MSRIARKLGRSFFETWTAQTVDRSKNIDRIGAIDQASQILLGMHYRDLLHARAPRPDFADVEFRCFSQNGEDGILLYLFSMLGHGGRRVVEMCVSDGLQCNATNLIVNHGWQGLLFDGNPAYVERGRRFFAKCPDTFVFPPKLERAWITAGNVDSLLVEQGWTGEVDLFSLDMDGVDYWIWKAVTAIQPRVVMVEINTMMGADRAVTVPYREDFAVETPGFFGASLPAFVKLGRAKGYRLVGAQRYGFNVVFLRDDVGVELFPEVPASACLDHPYARQSAEQGRGPLGRLDWVDV